MLAKFADFQIFVALVSAIIVASFAKLLTAQDERPTIVGRRLPQNCQSADIGGNRASYHQSHR